MPEKRWKRWLPWMLMATGTIAIVAVVLELGATLILGTNSQEPEAPIKAHDMSSLDKTFQFDVYTWWKLQPGLDNYHVVGRCWGKDVDFHFSTDSEGVRLDPGAPEAPETRILALGDSVTFGLGVSDAETWPAQLRARLAEMTGANRFRVINFGTPGYSAFQGLRQLDKRGLTMKPDLVVACFGQNDFDTWNTTTDLQRAMNETSAVAAKESGQSDLFVLARMAIAGARELLSTSSDAPLQPRLTREEFRDTLEQIRLLCVEQGIPLILLRWPQEPQVLEKNPTPINYEDIILSFQGAEGVTLLDLYPAFAAEERSLYIDPVHGSAAGCEVAAHTLAGTGLQLLGGTVSK